MNRRHSSKILYTKRPQTLILYKLLFLSKSQLILSNLLNSHLKLLDLLISQILIAITSFACKACRIVGELKYGDNVPEYGLGADDVISNDLQNDVPQDDKPNPVEVVLKKLEPPQPRPN